MPNYRGYDKNISLELTNDNGKTVWLTVLVYETQTQGKELIHSMNKLVNAANEDWRIVSRGYKDYLVADESVELVESEITGKNKNITVWHWNRVDKRNITSASLGKILEAKNKLLLRPSVDSAVFLSTDTDNSDKQIILGEFAKNAYKHVQKELDRY